MLRFMGSQRVGHDSATELNLQTTLNQERKHLTNPNTLQECPDHDTDMENKLMDTKNEMGLGIY